MTDEPAVQAKGAPTPAMQRHVLATMLRNKDSFARCRSFMAPELFSDETTSDVIAWALHQWDAHKELPGRIALLDAFKDNENARRIIKRAYADDVDDDKITIERIATFARTRAIKKALQRAVEITTARDRGAPVLDERGRPLKPDQIPDPVELIQTASMVGCDTANDGVLLSEALQRIKKRALNPVKPELFFTGMEHLDECGLAVERGEVGSILARAKGGKSHTLLNIAVYNAMKGYNVSYYNMEIKEARLEDRVGNHIAGPKADRKLDPVDYVKRLQQRYDRMFVHKGDILFQKYVAKKVTMDEIRAHMMRKIASGFVPDLVIVDYLGLVRPSQAYDDPRHALSSVWLDFRSLCQEFKVGGWSALQANREGARQGEKAKRRKDVPDDTNDLIGMGHIGEAYEVAQHIDVGASINRNVNEVAENKGRFYIFASRNDKDGQIINFECDYGRSIIKTTGYAEIAATGAADRRQSSDEQKEEIAHREALARRAKQHAADHPA